MYTSTTCKKVREVVTILLVGTVQEVCKFVELQIVSSCRKTFAISQSTKYCKLWGNKKYLSSAITKRCEMSD